MENIVTTHIETNTIVMFTHQKLCTHLTVDIIKYWKHNTIKSILKIVDFFDNSLITINLTSKDSIHKIISKDICNEMCIKIDVTSYPSFFVFRNTKCIEQIYGTYENILKIISFYL